MGCRFGNGEVVGGNARLRYDKVGSRWAALDLVIDALLQALRADNVYVGILRVQPMSISMRSREVGGWRSIVLAGRVENERRSVLESICRLQGQSGRTQIPQQHGVFCGWSLFKLVVALCPRPSDVIATCAHGSRWLSGTCRVCLRQQFLVIAPNDTHTYSHTATCKNADLPVKNKARTLQTQKGSMQGMFLRKCKRKGLNPRSNRGPPAI
jgi:hypothetical protein